MVIKTKYKFGDFLYLKNDPEQSECILIGVIQEPGTMCYRLRCMDGEIIEVYDFEVTDSKDPLKTMGINSKEEEDG